MFIRQKILIVEDMPSLSLIAKECLMADGFMTETAETGAAALRATSRFRPDAILLDLGLPDMDGLQVLKQLRAEGVHCVIIIMTAQNSLRIAIDAMQAGADDFITKPFEPDLLPISVRKALEKKRLEKLVSALEDSSRVRFQGFIGAAPEMRAVYHQIENAAASQAAVIVNGESGTGKELAAQAIHALSGRRGGEIVALNCAAIPASLLESEIFGHVKGAFTGATENRKGAAALAHKGTLFLDELTEMPMDLQSKLLRFVQTGTYTPLGGSRAEKADIRFICATNREPMGAIRDGRLREDLFYRLAVIPISLPPLRERGDDVLLLASHFLATAAQQENRIFTSIAADARSALLAHAWPGNVRELENVIRRAVIMNKGEVLTAAMLSFARKETKSAPAEPVSASPLLFATPEDIRPMAQVELDVIERAIKACGGNISEAARRLAIHPVTIHRKRKAAGV